MNAIEVSGLVKRFGGKTVVDNVSMSVAEGEIVGFLGPNGSGKTTTIRMLMGLIEPTSGSARVLGRPMPRSSRSISHGTRLAWCSISVSSTASPAWRLARPHE